MNARAVALQFAHELGLHRPLTPQEAQYVERYASDPRCNNRGQSARQRWTLADTRQLRKLMAKGCTRREIAQAMGRSCFTIDKRIRRIKGGARG